MRIGGVPGSIAPGAPPTWPPLLAVRGPGAASAPHAHHGMHVVVALEGELTVEVGRSRARRAVGVITAPDVPHRIDARGATIFLVFLDPESAAGTGLRAALGGDARLLDARARDAIVGVGGRDADPHAVMSGAGEPWTRRVVESALGVRIPPPTPLHPGVRRVLRHVARAGAEDDLSLEALAAVARLSPGRLMHAFTACIGAPLRPYLAWLRVQRASAAIVSGATMTEAAHRAGFSDAAHMSRTFRRMLGMAPSALRGREGAAGAP